MDAQLTIDELAATTGVPSRTIRFYQAHGAIPAPERQGRVAYYGKAHVDRLKLVLELQERGLHLKAIARLLGRADAGEVSVADWLGLGDRLRTPWSDEHEDDLPDDALRERLHAQGMPVSLASELTEILRKGARATAHDLVRRLTSAARHPSVDLAGSVDALRAVATDALKRAFAREMEQELARTVASGKALRVKAHASRRARRRSLRR